MSKRRMICFAVFLLEIFRMNVYPQENPEKTSGWIFSLESTLHFSGKDPGSLQKDDYFNHSDYPEDFRNLKFKNLLLRTTLPERTFEAFLQKVNAEYSAVSPEVKLFALSYYGDALYHHYEEKDVFARGVDKDLLTASLIAFQNREVFHPDLMGTCRDYGVMTALFASGALGFPSLGVHGKTHTLVQVLLPDNTLAVVNGGLITFSVGGVPLKTKDDVDIAIMQQTAYPSLRDITSDPSRDKVMYENRFNNFSGFWRKLQNRDNTDRVSEFLLGDEQSLFAHQNERGVSKFTARKQSFGVQAYRVGNNNSYNRFLEGIQGLNVAFFPVRSRQNARMDHRLFTNLSVYRISMNSFSMQAMSQITDHVLSSQINVEDYLRYSAGKHLSIGMISVFQLDKVVLGRGESRDRKPDGGVSFSPFLRFETGNETKKMYFAAGIEVTDYMVLPDLLHFSALPWGRAGFSLKTPKLILNTALRGEFQAASQRYDLISTLQSGTRSYQLRAFKEFYTAGFRSFHFYENTFGIELILHQKIHRNTGMFGAVSWQKDNGGKTSSLFSLGLSF